MAMRCPFKVSIRLPEGCASVETRRNHTGQWRCVLLDGDGELFAGDESASWSEREALERMRDKIKKLYWSKPGCQ